MAEVPVIRLHGRRLPERLMRPAGVVEALEFGQLDVQGADAQLAGVELVELVSAGRVGAAPRSRTGCFAVARTRQDVADCMCNGTRGGTRILAGQSTESQQRRQALGCGDTDS